MTPAPTRLRSRDLSPSTSRAPVKEARAVLTEYLALRAELEAPRSASGGQLEAVRLGLAGDDDGACWRRSVSADRRMVRFQQLALVWAELDDEEQEIIRLQNTPVELEPDARRRRRSNGRRKRGDDRRDPREVATITRRRLVRSTELVDVAIDPRVLEVSGPPSIRQTRQGEEFVRIAPPQARTRVGHDGEVIVVDVDDCEGWSVVEDRLPRLPSHDEIAEDLGLTPYQVRRRVQSALAKVRAAVAGWARDEASAA